MAENDYQELWLMYYNIVVDILKKYTDSYMSDKDFRISVGQIFKNNKLVD